MQGTQNTLIGLCVCVFVGLLCTMFVPETKGKTLEEIWAERDGLVGRPSSPGLEPAEQTSCSHTSGVLAGLEP